MIKSEAHCCDPVTRIFQCITIFWENYLLFVYTRYNSYMVNKTFSFNVAFKCDRYMRNK